MRNLRTGEFGLEWEVCFPLFKKFIALAVDGESSEYAEQCAEHLKDLSESLVVAICLASVRYCDDFLVAIGEPKINFKLPRDVKVQCHPRVLMVPYPEVASEPVVHLELDCDWEEEHGMEWLIRDGRLLYVGAFHGEDPWSDFSEKEFWNFA